MNAPISTETALLRALEDAVNHLEAFPLDLECQTAYATAIRALREYRSKGGEPEEAAVRDELTHLRALEDAYRSGTISGDWAPISRAVANLDAFRAGGAH